MEITAQELENLKAKNLNPKFEKKIIDAVSIMDGFSLGCPVPKKRVGTDNFKTFSFWAFFFFVLPYLIRGMWRKAISLILIHWVGQILLGFLAVMEIINIDVAMVLMSIFSAMMCGYAAFNYYYDCFRKNARNEVFWF